jgi:hypothetical protein
MTGLAQAATLVWLILRHPSWMSGSRPQHRKMCLRMIRRVLRLGTERRH